MTHSKFELEAKLIIWSPEPAAVADEIAARTSFSGYRRIPRGSSVVRDVYVDTQRGSLGAIRAALRVRAIGPRRLITLKGAERAEGMVLRREELEVDWSGDNVQRVLQRLRVMGVPIPSGGIVDADRDPLDVLADVGFLPVHRRTTERHADDIVRSDDPGLALAELAIDDVRFHLLERDVRHYEIEVEATHARGGQVVDDLTASLLETWGSILRAWPFSKYGTGCAIEEVLADQGDSVMAEHGGLHPWAYDAVARRLGQERSGHEPSAT